VNHGELGRRGRGSALESLRAEVDARFQNLPEPVRVWLAEQPRIVDLLSQLERHLASGAMSGREVARLAKRWQETLPPRRGAVLTLSDFMQLEFELGLPRRRRKLRRTGRKIKGEDGALTGKKREGSS
jgi:hypothetical protein